MVRVELGGALRRRWYVAVAGLLVTAGATFGAWSATPLSYTASGTIILIPSARQASVSGNPFLSIAYLDAMAAVIMKSLGGDEERARIAERFPDAGYELGADMSTRGPTVQVSVSDASAPGSIAVLNELMGAVPERLASLQADAGVPEESIIGWMELARDDKPTVLDERTTTAVAQAGAVGLALTVGLTVGVDLLVQRVRRR